MVNRLIKVIQCNDTIQPIKDNHNTRQQTQQDKQNKQQTNTQANERTQTNTTQQHNTINYINISLINTITYKHNHISIHKQSYQYI